MRIFRSDPGVEFRTMAVRQLVCGWSSHRWGGRHRPGGGALGAPGPGRVAICVDGDGLRHGGRHEEQVGGEAAGAQSRRETRPRSGLEAFGWM